MRHFVLQPACTAAVLLVGCGAPGPDATSDRPPERGAIAITHVSVVDVATGTARPKQTLVVTGGRIDRVGPSADIAVGEEMTVVDGRGRFLIPGLWDMHVHTTDQGALARLVAHGVLGVRDMGGGAPHATDGCESIELDSLLAWRARITAGEWIGPRMVLAGPVASGTGWRTSLAVRTPDEARAAVATLRAAGADFVKIYEKVPLDAYRALAAAARAAGLTMAGHVPVETVSLREAIEAGQRSIEHVRDALLLCHARDSVELAQFFAADGWTARDAAWGRRMHADCEQVMAASRAGTVWLTPTLAVERSKVAVDDSTFVSDARRRVLPASVQAAFGDFVRRKRQQPAAERASERLWWRTQQRLVRRARDAGVSFLAGSDAACEGGLHGSSLHDELALLVESGLSPAEALRAATLVPAEFLHATDSLGAIAPRMVADLVLLDANPLDDIGNTRRIHAIVSGGRLLDRGRLDAMLDPATGGAPQVPPRR